VIIAAAQLDAPPNDHAGALALLERTLASAGEAELVVLPELALCGYGDPARIRRLAVPLDHAFVGEVAAVARRAGKGLIAGYAERDGDVLYNAALAIGPDGAMRGNYRKAHLWGGYERDLFAPGTPSPVMPWGPLHLGLLICYDLEFPEAARDLALRGADTLVVISATSVPYDVVPEALVPARGYETGCHVVFANWAGSDGGFEFLGASRITAPDGEVLAAAPGQGGALAAATVGRGRVVAWRGGHGYLADRRPDLYRWT